MQIERRLIKRIDVGNDCVLIYRAGGKVALVVTTRDNGDAEVFLEADLCLEVIAALNEAAKK